MPLTQREKDEIAQQAIEHAERMARLREDQLPWHLNVAQLRARIARARVDADRHQESAQYHQNKTDELADEIAELTAELRKRPEL